MSSLLITRVEDEVSNRNFNKLRDFVTVLGSLPIVSNTSDGGKQEKSSTRGNILDGLVLEKIEVETGGKTTPHNLGRPPTGFIVVKSREDVRVWDTSPENDPSFDRTKNITLTSSSNATVSIWMF